MTKKVAKGTVPFATSDKNGSEGTHELPPISWTSRNGRFSYARRPQGEARYRGEEDGGRALRAGPWTTGRPPRPCRVPRETVRQWRQIYRAFGSEALLTMDGKQAQVHIRAEGRRGLGRGRRRDDEGRGDGRVRDNVDVAAGEVVRALPRGRRRGACAQGPRAGRGARGRGRGRTREQELEERCRRLEAEVAYLKKLRALVERDGL